MSGFIEGENRYQSTMFPERVDEYVAEHNPVRVIDVFIDDLDVSGLGFKTEAADTGRPGYTSLCGGRLLGPGVSQSRLKESGRNGNHCCLSSEPS